MNTKPKKKEVLVFLNKMIFLYSGLGKVAYKFGKVYSEKKLDDIEFTFVIPEKYNGIFGSNVKYINYNLFNRLKIKYSNSYDLIHYLDQHFSYYKSNTKTTIIVTVHDMNFLYSKKGHKIQKYFHRLRRRVQIADKIICISNFTKADIIKHYGIDKDKISIIRHEGENFSNIKPLEKKHWDISKDFFLFVGELRAYKNVKKLIELFSYTKNRNLIIVGNSSQSTINDLQHFIDQKELSNNIRIIQNCSDEELSWFYRHCCGYISLSKAEGIGLPILESLRLNKKPFLSQDTCHRETGSKYSFYFKSKDVRSMANELEKEINDNGKNISSKYSKEDILNHIEMYSWKHNYTKTISLYREVLGLSQKE